MENINWWGFLILLVLVVLANWIRKNIGSAKTIETILLTWLPKMGMLIFTFVVCQLNQSSYAQESNPSIGDTLLANQLLTKATDQVSHKKYDSANYYYQKAANLFREANISERYFDCIANAGYQLNVQRKYEETISFLDSIEQNFSENLNPDSASYQRFYGVLSWSHFKLLIMIKR